MSFMNKLMFWKKKDNLGLNELKKDITESNTGIKDEAMRPDYNPQDAQVSDLGLKELNSHNPNQNKMFGQQNYGYNPNYGYAQNPQNYSNQNYNKDEIINKSLEVISAKLDALKMAIDNLNQRLNNIEERLKNRW